MFPYRKHEESSLSKRISILLLLLLQSLKQNASVKYIIYCFSIMKQTLGCSHKMCTQSCFSRRVEKAPSRPPCDPRDPTTRRGEQSSVGESLGCERSVILLFPSSDKTPLLASCVSLTTEGVGVGGGGGEGGSRTPTSPSVSGLPHVYWLTIRLGWTNNRL